MSAGPDVIRNGGCRADEDAEIEPVPTEAGGRKPEPELDRLSNILKTFNKQFGTLFTDSDRVAKRIRDDIAPKVAADPFQSVVNVDAGMEGAKPRVSLAFLLLSSGRPPRNDRSGRLEPS